MKAEKDIKTGKWLIQYRYTDWQGIRKNPPKEDLTPNVKLKNGLEISLQHNKLT